MSYRVIRAAMVFVVQDDAVVAVIIIMAQSVCISFDGFKTCIDFGKSSQDVNALSRIGCWILHAQHFNLTWLHRASAIT